MKNGVKCYKDFFGYFNALKTNCVIGHERTLKADKNQKNIKKNKSLINSDFKIFGYGAD